MQFYKYIYLSFILIIATNCNVQSQVKKTLPEKSFSSEDEALLDRVQKETFNYFWEAGEPISGGARERVHMDDLYPTHPAEIITSGGTGFGIMALLVGIERKFITREEGYQRLLKLTNWLEKSDRFHGAWPHWWNPDGTVYPFSKKDDGGDLVETAFLVQGLITARQYFQDGNSQEKELATKMDKLWKEVDWNWYTQGKEVMYWHWSPKYNFEKNFDVRGHNECLIMYVLAASSPTHSVSADVFHKGYMRNGDIVSDNYYYGLPTILDHYESNDMYVGPLFWAHYSHLGLNPTGLKSTYGDFWSLNQNHAKIHYRHAVVNPYDYRGYSDKCWGLTSSYSMNGYAGHNPQEDLGVISPTAALSSFPYTPKESMKFLKYLYEEQDSFIGDYGPYDAFSFQSNWHVKRYLAIDQLPIPVMIENYRTGFIWNLFMSAPEIKSGIKKLGFQTSPTAIKLMTYNIRLDAKDDGDDNWHERKADFIEYIESENPDFFGVQEAMQIQMEYINENLSNYEYIGVGRDDGKSKGEYSAIFYKKNKWSVEKEATIWLSETPNTPSKGWDANYPRVCTYGTFKNNDGKLINIFNTHFDHQSVIAREHSVDIIKSLIESEEMGTPLFLMGDFNLDPTDNNYERITNFLNDTRDIAQLKLEYSTGTFNGFKTEGTFDRRIDYIFTNASNAKIISYKTDMPRTQSDRQLSDHFPVIIEVELK